MKRKDLINIQAKAIEQIKNGNDLKVYLAVVYYTTDPAAGTSVTLSRMSKDLNLDIRTIRKSLENLTRSGLIVTTRTPEKINVYGICDLSEGNEGRLYSSSKLSGTQRKRKRSRTPGDQAGKSCKGQQKQQKRKETAKNTTKTEKEVKA